MTFAHPTWLLGLLALPLVAGWLLWIEALRRRRLARFAGEVFWPSVAGSVSPPRRRHRMVLRLLGIGFLVLAAARPQWGVKERPLVREGSDLIICLDVSTSMLARDIAPNRLERAKDQIKGLIRNLRGDRVGLVLFAGEAFVQCPPTLDYGLAAHLLELAGPDSVAVQGTRIGAAIRKARETFDRSALGSKAIILVTDGEDHDSDPIGEAEKAAKEGIIIECIGIGTPEGMPVLLKSGTYKEDRSGAKITSRLDVETLRRIALTTGGRAIITDRSGEMNLDALYQEIRGFQKQEMESLSASLLEDRFQWPLGIGLLLLLFETLLGDRVGGWRGLRNPLRLPRRGARGAGGVRGVAAKAGAGSVAAVALGFLLMPPAAGAFDWEFGNRPARLCEEGNAAYEKEQWDEALGKYLDALAEAPAQSKLDMNIGLALARQGKWNDALAAFQRAAEKAGDNPSQAARANYNSGVAYYEMARELEEKQQLDKALEMTGRCVDANCRALELQPDFGKAKQNLNESRRHLAELAEKIELMQQQQDSQSQQSDEKSQQDEQEKQQSESAQQQQGENQESEKQEGEGQAGTTPTPTLTPTPAPGEGEISEEDKQEPSESEQSSEGEKGEESEAAQAQESDEQLGEMTPEDAIRLLSTLPDEDLQALQKALRTRGGTLRLEKDW